MPTELREIININVTILEQDLLGEDAQILEFQEAMDANVRLSAGSATNVLTGQSHPTRTLNLDRDRISLNLARPRSTIVKEFPELDSLESELRRFSEVAHTALNTSRLTDTQCDFGYNVEMVFDQDAEETALEFIGKRILNYEVLSQSGRELVGGACRFLVNDKAGQWTYIVEPRAGELQRQRVFLGVNLHQEQKALPEQTVISNAISNIVARSKELMHRLDTRQIC